MNVLFRHSEAGCQGVTNTVGILRSVVHLQVVTIPGSDRGVGFHWIMVLRGGAVSLINTNLSSGKSFIDFASFDVGCFPGHRMRLGCFGPFAVHTSSWRLLVIRNLKQKSG